MTTLAEIEGRLSELWILEEESAEICDPVEAAKTARQMYADIRHLLAVIDGLIGVAAGVASLKKLLVPGGDYSFTRKDGEKLGLGDLMIIGIIVEKIDNALAALPDDVKERLR
jgi:hypothetical protein